MLRTALLLSIFIVLLFSKPVESSPTTIVLNEISPHPAAGEDWVELYNPTSTPVDLTNWTLSDSTSSMKTLTGSVPPQGYGVIDVSNRLNNTGDTVTLKDTSGAVIDTYTYSADPGSGQSWGRSPDGESWTKINISRGGANTQTSSSPTPEPSSSPSPSPSANTTPNVFSFATSASSISTETEFPVTTTLTHLTPNTPFYLKAAFYKTGSTNYFGQTKVGSTWVKNGQTYKDQLMVTTDSQGDWTGTVLIQADSDDSGFTGNGEYQLKIGRYSATGSGPTWSNSVSLQLTAQPKSSPSPTPKTSSTPSPSPIASSPIPQSKSTSKTTTSIVQSFIPELPFDLFPSESSPSASESAQLHTVTTSPPWVWWVGGGASLVASGIGVLVYFFKRL